jgi:hypothetical protein
MSQLITGIFPNRGIAERATQNLIDAGFAPEDTSILMSEGTRGREFQVEHSTKAPEGAVTGATVGGVLGAVAAGLVALGTLAVPGVGLVAAGPIVAALSGLGAGAAAGGLVGGLVGLGIPEHEAKFYDEELRKGGILVGVYAHGDRVKLAREILDAAGATKVH